VSVVPDHIHVAVWSHPTLAAAELVVQLLSASQGVMRDNFDDLLIRAGVPRLWKPSAYVGSYGDISKDHVRNYLRKWGRAAG
jgi:REP element-mobilizing transposase RayT